MKNKELFTLNPEQVNLKNEGVAKIRAINEKEDLSIVEYELKTFVCEGEYHDGLKRMLENYANWQNEGRSDVPAFWVSGFYGSGKSHLVKMASYLWNDFEFPNGKTARSIKPLPRDIQDLFVEIDRKQKNQGKLSIAGTLRDFPSKDIHYSFLQIFLNSLGLPQQYHHFKFVHWLKKEGIYDGVHAILETGGKNLKTEIERIFVSTALAKAVLELKPEMADSEAKLLELFRAQFARLEKIGREDFVETIREEILPLFFGNKIPCTIIILDEVQQFIGQDSKLAFDVQLLAEDLCSRFDGKFLLVGTGQNALTDTPILQKLMARFRIPVGLQDTDVQTVIRKTILDKKPTSVAPLNKKLDASSGEISRNLEGTVFGYLTEDKNTLVADYPLLPSTRKFWYKVLQVVDVAGTSGQLRNQLRLIDDSLKTIAEMEIGQIVPADFIFTQTRADLIQAGLLLNDTSNLIQGKKARGGDAEIEGRILSAVFLLDQITSNISETGLKSNENTIADLLIDNLNTNSDAFRSKVKGLIKKLVDEKVLMPINDEFKLQTKIGAEWEQEFTKQYIKLNNSGDDQIQSLRREKIIAHFKQKTGGISVTQGTSRMVRNFELWDKDTMPNTEHKLNLWIRDGWFENETSVENEIRAAGNNAPLAYAFVKKFRDPELRTEIIKFLAAGLAINAMGLPSTPEGEQAKKSMETRQSQAKTAIQDLIEKICDEAIVFLAGGNKVQAGTLKENIQEALNSIADRQFPDFKNKADFLNWGQALTRALAGNPDALNAINYTGDVDKHPVASEILRFMGNSSKTGKDIRNQFMKAPYGWPQDAVDTMLIMLKNMQHISASETDLKVARINQATFKKEVHILGAKDKIAIRKLFQDAGITCPPNHEIFPYSNDYLDKLKTLATQVGGDAPRPEPIHIEFIKDIENKEGNERLLEILQQKAVLQARFSDWSAKSKLVSQREPQWTLLVELMSHAPENAEMEQLKTQVDAISDNRLLLQEPDLIQPILTAVTDKLLTILNQRKEQYNVIYDIRMGDLQANTYFKKLTPEQKHGILARHQLLVKPEIKILDSHSLLNQLNKASLYTWDTKIAALPGQFQSALEDAVLLSAPQAKTYSLPRITITSQAEIDSYVAELKAELEALLNESSSIILK
ncbi:MAG TPA: BREX system P-loop protein BrxC [Lacibacter sp.]|nr:BREX system P-loop protein BrxC [Lacibacter sp.]HMO89846.1 BREX system P-loop protein BrxC [Lacibacter sp.]